MACHFLFVCPRHVASSREFDWMIPEAARWMDVEIRVRFLQALQNLYLVTQVPQAGWQGNLRQVSLFESLIWCAGSDAVWSKVLEDKDFYTRFSEKTKFPVFNRFIKLRVLNILRTTKKYDTGNLYLVILLTVA